MALFQTQVERQFLAGITTELTPIYKNYLYYFGNPAIQANILELNEQQYQGEFIEALFVNILGYTAQPQPNFNLLREKKNETDAKSADAAISINNQIVAVIELKDHKTQDLKKVEVQAFGYKNNHKNCHYIITSNFERLRFYIDNAVDYIEFDLFNLTFDEFRRLWLCLSYESIAKNLPQEIKNQSISNEDTITKQLYKDYSVFKRQLFESIVSLNPAYDKLLLFKKTQKLLDRFLFLLFAEDKALLPTNSVMGTVDKWRKFNADPMNDYQSLHSRFVKYFNLLNVGYKDAHTEIYAYNGGLFANDDLLNQIKIEDSILSENVLKLAAYDYGTDVDVNILGHIFENSLNEIEQVANEINTGVKTPSKRKQDGVFYTPRYITQYIVENTVGRLCEEKKTELGIGEELFEYKRTDKRKQALKIFDSYREWLLHITIVDPACGSGAFLNMALDFLITEHNWIDRQQEKITGLKGHYSMELSNIENTILENNLFGVDINDESVEIAKLSLWLRTAKPHRKLNSLNNNIKCGNSLVDDPAVAGDKAFDWHTEFPQVFKQKDKKIWHVTWVTHDTRTSARMIKYKVREMKQNGEGHIDRPYYFDEKEAIEISRIISNIIVEDEFNCLEYNICSDHVHIILVCDEEELPNVVRKLKGKSAQKFKEYLGLDKEETFHLWAQKFNRNCIAMDIEQQARLINNGQNNGLNNELYRGQNNGLQPIVGKNTSQLQNTINYIRTNREKHGLPDINNGLQPIVEKMRCNIQHAFRTEYKGGFDVVIGNPPYVFARDNFKQIEKDFYVQNYSSAKYQINTYLVFIEKTVQLIKKNGIFGLIIPNSWLMTYSGEGIRKYLLEYCKLDQIINLEGYSFESANVETVILIAEKRNIIVDSNIDIFLNKGTEFYLSHKKNQQEFSKNEGSEFKVFLDDSNFELNSKISTNTEILDDLVDIKAGLQAYEKDKGEPKQTAQDVINRPYDYNIKFDEETYKYLEGKDVCRYNISWSGLYLKYGKHLAAPRTFNLFDGKKIIVREITGSYPKCIISTYSEDIYLYNRSNIAIIEKENGCVSLKYILTILNSSLISYYFMKNTAKSVRKLFPKVILNDLRKFPIKNISLTLQQPFITKADAMLSYNKELQLLVGKFQRMVQRKFELEVLPTKLQNWYLLSYKEFIAELGKKKVKLTLAQEAEWEDYFHAEQAKAIEIKTQIEKTDQEIDRMVYELYELTGEEIKIVEGKV